MAQADDWIMWHVQWVNPADSRQPREQAVLQVSTGPYDGVEDAVTKAQSLASEKLRRWQLVSVEPDWRRGNQKL